MNRGSIDECLAKEFLEEIKSSGFFTLTYALHIDI